MDDRLSLRHWRQLRNLTQAQLAEKTGLSTKSIYEYEADVENLKNASFKRVEQIAEALEVAIDQIKFF